MNRVFLTHFTVFIEGEGTFTRLFLELFVILVVLSDIPKCTTSVTLQSNNLSWSFFLFCHRFLYLFASRRGIVYQKCKKVRILREVLPRQHLKLALCYTRASFFLGSAIDHVMLPKKSPTRRNLKVQSLPRF